MLKSVEFVCLIQDCVGIELLEYGLIFGFGFGYLLEVV